VIAEKLIFRKNQRLNNIGWHVDNTVLGNYQKRRNIQN